MPFNCELCGRRSDFPKLMPAIGNVLRCPHCADERSFFRPPLLVVTGVPGVGKSTLCARLAGKIPGSILLDVDVFAEDFISVVPPNQDYRAFWRSMLRLAHELAQNGVMPVFFSTMLPEQLLENTDALDYFRSIHFLCLTCSPEVLRARLGHREGIDATSGNGVASVVARWSDFQEHLVRTASATPTATVLDASGTTDQVEAGVRHWIDGQRAG